MNGGCEREGKGRACKKEGEGAVERVHETEGGEKKKRRDA